MVSAHRANSFDALRLIAAFMVLVGHAFVLTGAGPVPRVAGIPVHTFGVCVFFAISGYLIAGSWQRNRAPLLYLKSRALRIFPALIVVVVLTIVLIGPIATARPFPDYWRDPLTSHYLVNILLFGQYDLPGVFDGAAHTRSAVNGSLWTLGVEFTCYLGLLALLWGLPKLRAIPLVVAAAATGLVALLAPSQPALMFLEPSMQMATFFFVAAAIRVGLAPKWIRLAPAVVALMCWLVASTLAPALSWPLGWLLLTYAAIGIGSANLPVLRRAGRFGDYSYGLYLWAFPVQQLVVGFLRIDSLVVNIIVVSAITLPLAFASWHLVEKRALALKGSPVIRTQRPAIPRQA